MWYPFNQKSQPESLPVSHILEYMSTSYLDPKYIALSSLQDDLILWDEFWEDDQHNRLFEMELNYQEKTIHLRILSLDEFSPLYHIHYWWVQTPVLDACRVFGEQYMKRGSMSYIFA